MRQLYKNLLCALCLFALGVQLVLPAAAADEIPTYQISDAGLEMIIGFEGMDVHGVWDYGHWTIGHGTAYDTAIMLFPEIAASSPTQATITEAQAQETLLYELAEVCKMVNGFLLDNHVVVNQNQFDALVSFAYNLGNQWITYRNADSTPCKLVQMLRSDPSTWTMSQAQAAFGTWNKAGGVVRASLIRRREIEATLFMTPIAESPASEDAPESAEPDNPSEESIAEPAEPTEPDVSSEASATPGSGIAFLDVDSEQWYSSYVMLACQAGLMKGYSNGYFGPEDSVTRSQLLQALANFDGVDLSLYTRQVNEFTDVPPDAWYSPAVAWSLYRNLIETNSTGNLNPNEVLEREEMCVILARYLSSYQLRPTRIVPAFLDEENMTPAGRSAMYYCVELGLMDGVGDGYFDPSSALTRGQLAKILLGMQALLHG